MTANTRRLCLDLLYNASFSLDCHERHSTGRALAPRKEQTVRPEHEVEVAARALRGHSARLAVVAGAHVRVGLLHDAQVRDAGEARGAEGAVEEAPEAALVVGCGRRARLEDAGLCEHLRLRTGGRREQGGCC